MKRFKKILVTADTRYDDHPIVESAVEIARENGASVTIVDVIPDFSWIARLAVKELENIEQSMRQEKAQKLENLATLIRDQGIDVETKLLGGKTSVSIVREVLNGGHDLVMAVSKGKNSVHRGYFGQTARRLLRTCPCAVWLIPPGVAPHFQHILASLDTSSDSPLDMELNEKVYELASSLSAYHECNFSLVHAWDMEDEAMLNMQLKPNIVAEYVDERREHCEKLLDQFLKKYEASSSDETVYLLKGMAPEVIAQFTKSRNVDLVVMGTVARSGLSGMFMGNTSEKILDHLNSSVLALKPYSFKCPISR